MLAEVMSIWRGGDTAGLGTVVRTFHSAPRPPGASMVVAPDGSVSWVGIGRLRGGRRLRTGHRGGPNRDTTAGTVWSQRQRCLRGRPDLRRHHRHLRRVGVAGDVSQPGRGGRRRWCAPCRRSCDRDRAPRRAVGRPQAHRPAGHDRPVRWVRPVPTRPSATTRAACSRWAAARCSSLDPTGSVWARAWRSSCPATLRARGCWCLVPSTSRLPWPDRAPSSATELPSAMPARCSPLTPAFPRPTRWSSTGPTGTSPPRPRLAKSTRAR